MNNFDDFKIFLAVNNPACVCLQETYFTNKMEEGKEPNINYSYYRKDKLSDHRAHGGVAVLVRTDIPSSRLDLDTNLQAVAVKIQLHKSLTICSLYLPPNEQIDKVELDNLFAQLQGNILILGDYNAHNTLWHSDHTCSRGRKIEDVVSGNNLIFLNENQPTHRNSTSLTDSIIDLTVASPSLKQDFRWSVLESLLGSDHFPVLLETILPSRSTAERIPKWILEKADWEGFTASSRTRRPADSFNNAEEMVSYFEKTVIDAAEKYVPKSSTKPRHVPVPWWNNDCKEAIEVREKALKKFKKEPTEENRINYSKLKAIARRTVRKAKRESWEHYVNQLNREATGKQVWHRIARIQHKGAREPITILKDGPREYKSQGEIANHLGETFAYHSSENRCHPEFLPLKRQSERKRINFQNESNESYNDPFTKMELRTAIHSAKDTSPGEDRVHYQMLKHLGEDTLEFLLEMYNYIWQRNQFPLKWRKAIVIAIAKPGKDHSKAENYRPIALTSCLCKVMERMVNQRLNWFLEYHQLIDKNQCGFRSSRGTIDHLVRLDGEIRSSFLRKQHLLAIFFDIKKAYDTCWKYGILEALYKYGLRGNLPMFVENFLRNRTFQVRVGTFLSEEYPQELGVPQGSVLSPTLFSVAINSVLSVIPPTVGRMLYVDDLTIYSTSPRLEGAERQITSALKGLERWTRKTGFSFSPTKSVCVHFHRRRGFFPDPQFSLENEAIPVQPEVKYLGLIFDYKLTWVPHLRWLKLRCARSLNILRMVSGQSWGADRTVLLRLYKALVRSKIDYGCQAYGSACNSSLKMLDPIHHQALRICLGAFRTSPVESLYVEAHEPSLSNRRMTLDLQYLMRLEKLPSHPTTELSNDASLDARFLRLRGNPPFGVRSRALLGKMAITKPNIAPLKIRKIPPWKTPDLKVCSVYQELPKKEIPEREVQQSFLEHQEECHRGVMIYTDGSKQEEGVGSAIVILSEQTIIKAEKLPQETSVYVSELNAIHMAIAHFQGTDERICSVFTDSQSALCMLENVYSPINLVQEIHELIYKLEQKRRRVHLCWVPAHVGIFGNELADKAAKEAVGLSVVKQLPIISRDMHPIIRSRVVDLWQHHWTNVTENKLREIKPTIGIWKSGRSSSRFTETRIARIRIGHTFKTHAWILKREPKPQCNSCACDLSIRHILGECPEYQRARREAGLQNFPGCLGEEMDLGGIMFFLRQSGLLKEI